MSDLAQSVQDQTFVLLTAAGGGEAVALKCSQTNYFVPLQARSCSLQCCFMTPSSSTNERICVVLKQGEDQHQPHSVQYGLRHVYCLGLVVTLHWATHFILQSGNLV